MHTFLPQNPFSSFKYYLPNGNTFINAKNTFVTYTQKIRDTNVDIFLRIQRLVTDSFGYLTESISSLLKPLSNFFFNDISKASTPLTDGIEVARINNLTDSKSNVNETKNLTLITSPEEVSVSSNIRSSESTARTDGEDEGKSATEEVMEATNSTLITFPEEVSDSSKSTARTNGHDEGKSATEEVIEATNSTLITFPEEVSDSSKSTERTNGHDEGKSATEEVIEATNSPFTLEQLAKENAELREKNQSLKAVETRLSRRIRRLTDQNTRFSDIIEDLELENSTHLNTIRDYEDALFEADDTIEILFEFYQKIHTFQRVEKSFHQELKLSVAARNAPITNQIHDDKENAGNNRPILPKSSPVKIKSQKERLALRVRLNSTSNIPQHPIF